MLTTLSYICSTRYGKYGTVNKCLQLSPTYALQGMGSIELLINAYNSPTLALHGMGSTTPLIIADNSSMFAVQGIRITELLINSINYYVCTSMYGKYRIVKNC